jgi:hypothetical protein
MTCTEDVASRGQSTEKKQAIGAMSRRFVQVKELGQVKGLGKLRAWAS